MSEKLLQIGDVRDAATRSYPHPGKENKEEVVQQNPTGHDGPGPGDLETTKEKEHVPGGTAEREEKMRLKVYTQEFYHVPLSSIM